MLGMKHSISLMWKMRPYSLVSTYSDNFNPNHIPFLKGYALATLDCLLFSKTYMEVSTPSVLTGLFIWKLQITLLNCQILHLSRLSNISSLKSNSNITSFVKPSLIRRVGRLVPIFPKHSTCFHCSDHHCYLLTLPTCSPWSARSSKGLDHVFAFSLSPRTYPCARHRCLSYWMLTWHHI